MKKKILGTIEKEYPEKAKEIYRERIKWSAKKIFDWF
jgi:hypothetical protein